MFFREFYVRQIIRLHDSDQLWVKCQDIYKITKWTGNGLNELVKWTKKESVLWGIFHKFADVNIIIGHIKIIHQKTFFYNCDAGMFKKRSYLCK